MRSNWLPLVLLIGVACTGATSLTDPAHNIHEEVTVNGALRLSVTDTPSIGGVLWARPSATPGNSVVTVSATRYGSLCQTAVMGQADVSAGAITLRVTYAERLTQCIAGIRALTYRAEVSGLSSTTYDLRVLHLENGRQDTVLTERVVIQ